MDAQSTVTRSRTSSAEVAQADLGDRRLNKRLSTIVGRLAQRPDIGFPQAMTSKAELEAFYQFLENDRVEFGAVLAPHRLATFERIAGRAEVVVIHDTTEFAFTTGRADLERLRTKGERARKGFLAHCALAVSADEHREPLGVVGAWPWMRGFSMPASYRKAGMQYDPVKESEQARWARGVQQVHADAPDPSKLIHVMDSEADDYTLLSMLVKQPVRFVIRGCYDRNVIDEIGRAHV